MAKKPYKFRQARKDAKAAAKKAFPGKVKAVRKDITGKITAEDRMALKDMADTAKKELGKKAYLSRAEYNAQRAAELEKFRESMREEFGSYGGKKATPAEPTTNKVTPTKKFTKKAAVKKAAVKKAVAKPAAATPATPEKPSAKTAMTRAQKSAANKAAWAKMTPAERKNWSASRATVSATTTTATAKPTTSTVKKAAAKPAAKATAPTPKRPTLATLKKNEAKGLEEAKKRVAAKAAANKPRTKITVDSKAPSTAKPTAGQAALKDMEAKAKAKAAAKKPKFGRIRGTAKAGAALALAGEVVSLAKGSTSKDAAEINRLRSKLADVTGKKRPSALNRFKEGAASEVGQLASLATMGIVGKTRRQRMDELNAKIAKASKPKQLRYGPNGESLVPGTKAYAQGSKTRPATPAATQASAGGSTTKATGAYTVKKGDTLSGIAKQNNVTLKELRDANPSIMKKKKYKQGNMIWSGTKVNIPKK